jgi:hypothetical protein
LAISWFANDSDNAGPNLLLALEINERRDGTAQESLEQGMPGTGG